MARKRVRDYEQRVCVSREQYRNEKPVNVSDIPMLDMSPTSVGIVPLRSFALRSI